MISRKNNELLKFKKRFLKQTHDVKLAESLSPITKKVDEVIKSTEELGEIVKESKPETPQLAIENTPTNEPIENKDGVAYDVELENTLNNMKDNTGFLKTFYDRERGWIWNGHSVKLIGGTGVEINDKKFNITQGIQNIFTQTSNIPLKKLNNQEREI